MISHGNIVRYLVYFCEKSVKKKCISQSESVSIIFMGVLFTVFLLTKARNRLNSNMYQDKICDREYTPWSRPLRGSEGYICRSYKKTYRRRCHTLIGLTFTNVSEFTGIWWYIHRIRPRWWESRSRSKIHGRESTQAYMSLYPLEFRWTRSRAIRARHRVDRLYPLWSLSE